MKVTDAQMSSVQGPTRFAIHSVEGFGKALATTTPVLTPRGFVPIGELHVGDDVIGSDGAPTKVVGVFPQGTKTGWAVTTTDGGSLVCCAEHLWSTTCSHEKSPRVRTTMEIRETLTRKTSGDHAPEDGTYPDHRLPVVRPVEFAARGELHIHPYLLGCLLGDGAITDGNPTITKPEPDVLTRCGSLLPSGDVAVSYKSNADGDSIRINGGATKSLLWSMGLYGKSSVDKFVPQQYLFASVADRLELLRGLCDTDGYVQHGTQIEYGTSSAALRDDVMFLARSLGAIVSTRTRTPHYTYKGKRLEGRPAHRVMIKFIDDTVPVSSAKHLAKWTGPVSPRYRSIESIEPAGVHDFVCIKVAAADGLFVAEDFIVTHNTTILAHFPGVAFIGAEKGIPRDLGFQVPIYAVRKWTDLYALLDSVRYDSHNIGTIAIDTVDWLEPMLWQYVCERDSGRETEMNQKGRKLESIEDYGYGKGYIVAEEEFRRLIGALDIVQYERGVHIALAMHSHVINFKNPLAEDFDRFEPKSHKRIARVVVEWSETMLFGHFETMSSKIPQEEKAKKEAARPKGFSSGRRLLGTRNNALYDAKNRLGLEPVIELGATADLIPLLLGHHLGVTPVRPMSAPASVSSPIRSELPEERVSTRTEQQGPQHAPPQRGNVPADSWVHERTSPAPGASSTSDANTDARTWTEPKSHGSQHTAAPDPLSPQNDGDTRSELVRALEAAAARSGAYRARVEEWVARAAGDPKKIAAIVNRVRTDLAPPQTQQS